MGLTPIYKSDDGWFNAAAAQAAFELVMEMEPEEAEMFTTMVVADTLWETIGKNQRTLQRHLDDVISKQASKAMEVLSKRADGEEVAAAIAKALNPYDYGYRFDERDFNRDRRTGRFKTKINYSAKKPLNDKTAASYRLPTKDEVKAQRGGKKISDRALAEHQQGYMQVVNFLDAFQRNGLAGENDFLYSIENRRAGRVRTERRSDTTVPDFDPEVERIVEIEARPAGLTAAGASFGLVSALGGSDRAGWVAADKMTRFEDNDKGFNAFGQAWLDSGEEVSSSNDRLYGRVKSGSDFLGHMAYGNPKLEIAAKFGSLVGQHGPQAEKVIGPKARVTMYRYRGTEKTPDPDLTREYEKAMRSPENVDGSESGTRAQRLATAFMLQKIPNSRLYDLNLKSGHTPPSEGVIIDKNGKLVTQAIGYGDDHYLPFNLRNLTGLKGGEYIRTRSVGGPTSEDIYTGLVTGAQRLTVVSRSGIFVVEFDDTFRGSRRYNDKAGRMVDRYEKLVDAVKSQQVTRQPLEPSVREAIRAEVNRTMDFASPRERQKAIQRKEEEYRMYPRVTAEDEKEIERRVGNLAVTDERAANKLRQELRNQVLESKSYNYKLNGDGYAAALGALQEQFPYYIASVRHISINENQPFATETDRGYVKPRHNRPDGALEGFYDAQILGAPKSAAVEGTGKFKASEADYQNWKRNSQNPRGRFVPVRREDEGGDGAVEGTAPSSPTSPTRSTGDRRADALASRLQDREISDKFADNAWKLRNELVKADAQPKEGARGYDLFQLGENEFKEAVKTKSEDLEYVLAPYQDAINTKDEYREIRAVMQAYFDSKGVAGGVVFDPAKHLGAKPTRPFAFDDDSVFAPGADMGRKNAKIDELSGRSAEVTSKPLNKMLDDKDFMTEIERLQRLRALGRDIQESGADDEAIARLRASGRLSNFSTAEIKVMREPAKIDEAIENTHRVWTLKNHVMKLSGDSIDQLLNTPMGERGELPKVASPIKRVIAVPPSSMKDKKQAAAAFEKAAEKVGDAADQLDPADPKYTELSELANDLYTSRQRPDHIESNVTWTRYQKWLEEQ